MMMGVMMVLSVVKDWCIDGDECDFGGGDGVFLMS